MTHYQTSVLFGAVYHRMIHAGLHYAGSNGNLYFVVRKNGYWWLMFAAEYEAALDGVLEIGPGNARQYRTLVDVWHALATQ